ncbi:MAG: glutamine-hydrolyzing carbamoyl-phosphate synthase small subunit [Hyphomicrobiales bacterium]|nr:glutamine-hydrolyzing carbamoyl-phosphate synthase small subunit [Hyphomicrobiales bacterium]MCP5372021.1 glutamine-hydrolyzing carbamoyl-phosphate synthase small subunit [Hyphomicrobiales bacterium]
MTDTDDPAAAPDAAGAISMQPPGCDGAVVLDDGSVFWGRGAGIEGVAAGEICFNTSMTGYQEILTDPSYAGQIITFTFPHIGNVGTNAEDVETTTPAVRGCILATDITDPANWRAARHLDEWLRANDLVAVTGVDTRRLTRRIRDGGAPNGAILHAPTPDERIDTGALQQIAAGWPGLEGMDLAKEVTCRQTHTWDEGVWSLGHGYAKAGGSVRHVVAVDYGIKRNILRCLTSLGCRVTVVPATATADEILGHRPDGVFLSNGPGDPAATGEYAVPAIRAVVEAGVPTFGICLGHQMLALALGAKTYKMHLGQRGANHPVKDLDTGRVEITSQNHGFSVDRDSLPANVVETHRSLFDGTVEGIRATDRPAFSVQYHPEASPGPQDSHYLFRRFVDMIDKGKG